MESIFKDLFTLSIPILEKILRPIIVYVFLIIGLRLAGKRELGQLNPFDLVVLLTISNTVQNSIIGNDNSLIGGLIGAATLLIVNFLVVRVVHKNQVVEEFIEGKEVYLIEHGKTIPQRLENEGIDLNEIEIAAHKQGFASLGEVESAVLDAAGVITFQRMEADPAEIRHQQLLAKISLLEQKVDLLSGMQTHARG